METDNDSYYFSIKIGVLFFVICILVLIALFSVYTIGAGERGVLLTFGKPSVEAMGEGLHFKFPLVQKIIKMDVKTQKYEADLTAASADLQNVNTKIAINYRIIPESVPEIYKTIGIGYAEKIIYPLEQETNKAATSKYTAVELITNRDQVRQDMKDNLATKLMPRGIIIEEVSIINFDFSPSFSQAIEAKVTAEQSALAAKNKLEQIKYEAEQRVTQATAEAEAIRIQAQAIQSQGGKDYVQLQWILKWDGKVSLVSTGNSGMTLIDPSSFIK